MRLITGQRDDRSTLSARILSRLTKLLDGEERNREDYYGEDVYMQWGFKLTAGLQYAIDNRLPYIIVDWGYFQPREQSFSISFNGFHGLSMPVEAIKSEPPRWHPIAKPWKQDGEYVYVYGQLQNDRATRGLHVEAWLRKTAITASKILNRPARIRPHPKMVSSWEPPLPSLHSTFDETFVAVTWTSSAAIESVLAGVPTVALHEANPATPVCATGYSVYTPERIEWLHDLSWRNYRLKDAEAAAKYILMGLDQAIFEAEGGHIDIEGLRV